MTKQNIVLTANLIIFLFYFVFFSMQRYGEIEGIAISMVLHMVANLVLGTVCYFIEENKLGQTFMMSMVWILLIGCPFCMVSINML